MGQNKDEPNLLDFIDPNKWTILPNTAGCFNAEDAVRTASSQESYWMEKAFVKLEVLGRKKSVSSYVANHRGRKDTIDDGFEVLVYCSDDPIFCQELDDMGVQCYAACITYWFWFRDY